MSLASKMIEGKEPELREYILPMVVLSTLCIGTAYLLVESHASREIYQSVKDLAYTVISDPLSK